MELYNDDCFNIFPEIKNKIVDLVVVDLPYGQTACKWDSCIDLNKMWEELKRIGKEDCIYVFFCTTKFGYTLIKSNQKWFKYDIVWEKHNAVGFLSCNKMPLRSHEMIYIFKKKQGIYNPQKTQGKPYSIINRGECTIYGDAPRIPAENKDGLRFPRSVLKYKRDKGKFHSTQKPLELCEWLVKTYSNKGDVVMDFTMGSGTTGVACKNTERRFIGIEKDEKYYEIAFNRINETNS